ncbi:arrestin domain-containing protein 1-like isoform X1 [Petromyzon marinus]|uniref:arrestin domain-containing protein 1-like isoform X1 n=1 Tax=Petromyzon marinus TaxID=7757 RepID=UPI003F71B2DF
MEDLRVLFKGNKVSYRPGDIVEGVIKVYVTAAVPFKAIRVRCVGRCDIGPRSKAEPDVMEQYINEFQVAWGKKSSGSLSIGKHSFPFSFKLPDDAPPSFDGKHGRVGYSVLAELDMPWYKSDQELRAEFTVTLPVDLNAVPDAACESRSNASKQVNYSLVKSGTLSLECVAERKGYVPGQVIQLLTSISNKTGKTFPQISSSLIQMVTYRGKRDIVDLTTLVTKDGGSVGPKQTTQWKERFSVPALPCSELPGCKLISLEHFVQVSVKSLDLTVRVPLLIGNVPIEGSEKPTLPAAAPACPAEAAPPSDPVAPSQPPQPQPLPEPDYPTAADPAPSFKSPDPDAGERPSPSAPPMGFVDLPPAYGDHPPPFAPPTGLYPALHGAPFPQLPTPPPYCLYPDAAALGSTGQFGHSDAAAFRHEAHPPHAKAAPMPAAMSEGSLGPGPERRAMPPRGLGSSAMAASSSLPSLPAVVPAGGEDGGEGSGEAARRGPDNRLSGCVPTPLALAMGTALPSVPVRRLSSEGGAASSSGAPRPARPKPPAPPPHMPSQQGLRPSRKK